MDAFTLAGDQFTPCAAASIAPLPRSAAALLLLAVLFINPAYGQRKPSICDVPDEAGPEALSPYAVTCAGKTDCLLADQLDVTPPATAAKPITALCARLQAGQVYADIPLPVPSAPEGRPIAFSVAPGRLLEARNGR